MDGGLDDRVFPSDHLGIDQNRFRPLDRNARSHQSVALPLTENPVNFREIGAGVASENFARIRRDLRQNGFTLACQDGDGIGQINLAVLVVGLYLRERGPEFFEREAINAGVNFVDVALLVGELRFFDDGADLSFGFAHDAPVAAWIAYDSAQDGCSGIASPMRM